MVVQMWIVTDSVMVTGPVLSRGVGAAGGGVVVAGGGGPGIERQPWPWQMAGWSARLGSAGAAVDVAIIVMGEGRTSWRGWLEMRRILTG